VTKVPSYASRALHKRSASGWTVPNALALNGRIRERLLTGEDPESIAGSLGVVVDYVRGFLVDERPPSAARQVVLPVVEERQAEERVKCVVAGAQVAAAACVAQQAKEGCFCPRAVFALNAVPAVTPREREDRLQLVARAREALRGGPRLLGPAAHVGEVQPLTAPGSAGLAVPGADRSCAGGERAVRGHGDVFVKDRKTGRRHGRVICDPVNAVPAADTTPLLVPSAPQHAAEMEKSEMPSLVDRVLLQRAEEQMERQTHLGHGSCSVCGGPMNQGAKVGRHRGCRRPKPEPSDVPTSGQPAELPAHFFAAPEIGRESQTIYVHHTTARELLAENPTASLLDYARANVSPDLVPIEEPIRFSVPMPSAAPTPPPRAATEEQTTMAPKKNLKPLNDLTDGEVKAARESWGSDYATAKGLGCSVYLLKKREKAIEERGRVQPGVETPPEAPPPGQHPREDHHGDGPCDACAPAPVSDIEQMLAERLAVHEAAIEKLRGHEREAVRIRAALSAMKAA
jgi:hypothetical protein